jgi:nitrite reductase/ring-hydroxylating ferredoxin subunit
MAWVRVCSVGELPPGQVRAVRAGIRRVAVANAAGSLHAFEDACKHMKAALSTGRLDGTTLTCSWHGWKYDVTTGACHDKEWGSLRTFPVKVEGGHIMVSVEETAEEPPDETEEFPTPIFRS